MVGKLTCLFGRVEFDRWDPFSRPNTYYFKFFRLFYVELTPKLDRWKPALYFKLQRLFPLNPSSNCSCFQSLYSSHLRSVLSWQYLGHKFCFSDAFFSGFPVTLATMENLQQTPKRDPMQSEATLFDCSDKPPQNQNIDPQSLNSSSDLCKSSTPDRLKVPKAFKYSERYLNRVPSPFLFFFLRSSFSSI